MAVQGPHDKEPTVEIPLELFRKYQEARRNREDWASWEKHYADQIQALMGNAPAATVDGKKVLSWRPSEKWSEVGIKREYPEIAQHFEITREVTTFDVKAFVAQHPDLAEPFRSRSFRMVEGD
jgi:hypothetical protein